MHQATVAALLAIAIAPCLVLQVGFGLWVAYGLVLQDLVFIVPNSLAAHVGAATIS